MSCEGATIKETNKFEIEMQSVVQKISVIPKTISGITTANPQFNR